MGNYNITDINIIYNMAILRKNTNPRYGIASELQSVLNANGMQADITMKADGTYQLITIAHNSSQPRYYDITDKQMEALTNGGTYVWNRNAYETFTSIVKDDYYMPGSYVSARNANSPVNLGLNGHRLNSGEYGYYGEPRFRPFEGPSFGSFGNSLYDILFNRRGYHVRRVDGRPFIANSAPVVIDRQDGRLKPGELQSGSYGFYDKGLQQKDPLQNINIEVKPQVLERPKGQAERLSDVYSIHLTFNGEMFQHLLSTHGIVIDEKAKTLTIKSSAVNKDLQYDLTDEELKKLMSNDLKYTDKKGIVHKKKGVSIDERLEVLNNVIGEHFADKITREDLDSKDYVAIKLKPEAEKTVFVSVQASQVHSAVTDIIDMRYQREDYHTGFTDKWNSIGVVDGRMLSADQGFYLPVKNGRAVSVGEIQAYCTNDGTQNSFRMTAVINNQVMSHEISKEDYVKFINYDDEHRLMLFDKVFDEVQIRSSSNGQMQDAVRSGNLEEANGVVTLKGDYSLVSDNTTAKITNVMAWKDNITGNYLINVSDSKDVGMWSFKISEEQYNQFKDATDAERANMLTTMLPIHDEQKQIMKVVETSNLIQQGTTNLEELRQETKIALLGDANVNGESLENIKTSKEWKRSGEHGRDTNVGDITVEQARDENGKTIEGKYKMSAVIDGNVFTHEITQKQYDKFLSVNDYQRMKLFDKIFPEVEMKTKEDHKFNIGAAILAAVTTGVGVVASLSAPPRPRPEIYENHNVYSKPGVVSPEAVSAALYESLDDRPNRQSESLGMGI